MPLDTGLALHPAERARALALAGFDATLREAGEASEPHRLCGHLFSLAKTLAGFYGTCPVLKAGTGVIRANRPARCRPAAQTPTQGLLLLGLPVPERLWFTRCTCRCACWAVRGDGQSERVRPRSGSYAERGGC
ncbi:DALR anticodon-binding domain-containing protein [Kitasatospora herbaricolor]|uniref:DALR anticodon-binding domain-containing protein n=1 Tax=Kitasatospora herbaricolor TaxID=68217 RepID=UPI0036DB2540